MRMGVTRTLATLAFVLIGGAAMAAAQQNPPGGGQPAAPAAPPLKLTSTALTDSTPLPPKYSCDTKPANISPPLQWSDVPKDTASFVLILHDPEPRPRKGFDDILHWMMWNIPASATSLPEGVSGASAELPDGSKQTNGQPGNGGNFGYRGPCAGPGLSHHYTFELCAIDQKVDLPATATRADVTKAIDGHIVGHAMLVTLFHH